MLISGEPGIGKTRLAAEAARYARGSGFATWWGTTWQSAGAPPYWPWVQVLRVCPGSGNSGAPVGDAGELARSIAPLLPEWIEETRANPLRVVTDSAMDRFRLFDAVTAALRSATEHRPLLIVLDDLQWADTPSLLLLEFVARHLASARLVVVGTYRDGDLTPRHPLRRIAGDLASACHRVPLLGLGVDGVASFLAPALGEGLDEALIRSVHQRTGGNPFFLREVVRELTMRGDRRGATVGDIVPESVREAVHRRLARLSDAVRAVLEAAAVIGEETGADVLAQVITSEQDVTVELLGEAVAEGLLTVCRGERYAFAHDLVREVLYAALDARRRGELHHQAATALKSRRTSDDSRYAAALAYHYLRASPAGQDKAVRYSALAGRRALAQLAYEDAVSHFERGLAMLDAGDEHRRAELLLELGQARRQAGNRAGAHDAFHQAAAAARESGDATMLARAALGYGAIWGDWSTTDAVRINREVVALLEEALAALGPADSAVRARVLARLARAHYFRQDSDRATAVSAQAVAMARRVDDPVTLAESMVARHDCLWLPGDPAPRLAAAAELLTLATDSGDAELALHAHALRFTAHLERGDVVAADAELDVYEHLADVLRQPRYRWYALSRRAVRAIMSGRFAEGQRLAEQARALGESAHEAEAEAVHFDACRMLGRERGFTDADLLTQLRYCERFGEITLFRVAAAHIAAELGREDDAAELLAAAPSDPAAIRRDWLWTGTMCLLGETVARLSDTIRAAALYPLLLPHANLHAVEGGATTYNGAVAHTLGLLAATLGRLEAAADHFALARAMHTRIGAHPWRARTEYELAKVRLTRGGEPAEDLLRTARATAAQLEMPVIRSRIEALSRNTRPEAVNVFRRDGEFWTLSYGRRTVRVGDCKGLADIAALLARPGREVDAMALAGEPEPGVAAPAARDETAALTVSELADPVLDARAVAAYRDRLTELTEEIDDADRCHDPARAAKARIERDAITTELSAALGLGGRLRTFPHAAERARKAVGNRIRSALSRIDRQHPALAEHLRASLSTGRSCRYSPAEPTTWQL